MAGPDLTRLQIMRVQVEAGGEIYHLEFPVPCLGSDVQSVVVTGLSDPKKLSGDWVCDPLTREQWEELG